tara:strand:- start:6688 stop:7332 length:645 start_codon:yes stop_codon:yes gene_type:complete
MEKIKAYRFDSIEEFNTIINIIGAHNIAYIPLAYEIHNDSGYLYESNAGGGWTSADNLDDYTYHDKVEVLFKDLKSPPLSLEQQLLKAATFLNKNIINVVVPTLGGNPVRQFKVTSIHLVKTVDDINTVQSKNAWGSMEKELEKNGEFAVGVSGKGFFIPLSYIKLAPKFQSLKLNDEYTARIYGDKVVVGCQTFDIDTIKKLAKVVDEFQEAN